MTITLDVIEARVREFILLKLATVGPISGEGFVLKLKEDAEELSEALDGRGNPVEEAADCLICLLGAFVMAGGTSEELLRVAMEKIGRNMIREWFQTEDGTFKHRKVPNE